MRAGAVAQPGCAHRRETAQGPCTDVLYQARREQKTVQGKERYKIRAGIESTTFEAVLAHSLRKSRCCGMAKTSLQHQLTGAAINLVRINAWLNNLAVVHCFSSGQAEQDRLARCVCIATPIGRAGPW
ncbi:transposase [Streptomyces acidicola]|uniref:transposase n=1 Tax=Streptomyces acidicola TaxID=2596892 RepID=UPI0034438D44